jgi:hypothetical protein
MVIDYLIGNKDSFAIEFSVDLERHTHNLCGWHRLWLGGKYVGAYEDICIFGVTLNELEHFVKLNINTKSFDGLSKRDIYRFIKFEDIPGLGKYWFTPGGDSFDDFSMVVYSDDETYKFIWKLRRKPFFDYKNYPKKGLQSAEVPIKDFKQVIENFRKQIEQVARME